CNEQEAEDRYQDPATAGLKSLDHEIAENVEQDVTGEHGDEGTKPEAEGPHHEGHEFDREQQHLADPVNARRYEQREEVQPVLPEADAEHNRETDQRHDAGESELAGDGERMRLADNAEGHVAHEVGKQQKDEGGEHPRKVLLAFRADAGVDHVVDEADQPFDHHLPAPRNELAPHSAEHEEPDRAEHDQRPQRAVSEDERIMAAVERAEDRLDLKLVHRIDVAGRHYSPLSLPVRRIAGRALRNPHHVHESPDEAEEQHHQQQPRLSPE